MEAFNNELLKVSEKKNSQVKNKDYTPIYNTVIHMLEDKNILVFKEAIRTVELLSILLQNNLKAPKVKTLINLLTGKYGETNTAVVTAIDKALAALVKNSISPQGYADLCVN